MKRVIPILIFCAIFVVLNMVAHTYEDSLLLLSQKTGGFGVLFYILTTALAIIIPIWSSMFLIPIAVVMWGSLSTALFSIVGWVIGAQVSFLLGRFFQKKIIRIFPSLHASQYIEALVSKKHPYLSLIFLRMTIPVDVLSYGLGLFTSRVTAKQNFFTTVIGVTPFAFIFSYCVNLSTIQILGIFLITFGTFFLYSWYMLKVLR